MHSYRVPRAVCRVAAALTMHVVGCVRGVGGYGVPQILAEFGVASDRVASLVASGVVADSSSKRSKL